MSNNNQPTPFKRALLSWADNHNIKPPDFARKMGYSYNHAYQLLRGNTDFTTEGLGRLYLQYGPEAAAEIADLIEQTPATPEAA